MGRAKGDSPGSTEAGEGCARVRVRRFALFALIGVVLVEAGVSVAVYRSRSGERVFPQSYVSRGIWSAYGLIRLPDSTSTDIAPSIEAAQRVLNGDGDLYRDFKRSGSSFIYPPTTALELAPFGWAASRFGMGVAVQAMDVVGRVATVVLIWVCLRFAKPVLRTRGDWAVCVLLAIAFFPLRWSIFCVQAQTLINACLAGAMLAYAVRRDRLCGVLIGLASCMKPHFALLVIFALARRRYRVATSAVATGCLFVAASLAIVGANAWVTYVKQIMPSVADGYAWYPNQSLSALARRWVGDAGGFDLVPASAGVRVFSWCATAAMIVLSALPRFRRSAVGEKGCPDLPAAADFGLASLALTLASPVTWNHHYGWTVALFAVCVALASSSRLAGRYLFWLVIAFALVGTSWSPLAEARSGVVSLVDSKMLFGALLLFVMCWRLCREVAAVRSSN